MPTYPIQLKRNGTAASTPSSLLHGEVALNYADGKLFWKDASNVIQSFTFQSYALASHTHAASDITSGTLDAARIANDSITYAKIQNVSATDRLLGRSSVGAGDVEEITCTAFGRSLIDDADAATARTTLAVQPTASPTFTGTVTVPGLTATAAILADDLSSANSVVYSFDGDPNTGVGRGGADILTLVTAGSERMRVGSGGRVQFFAASEKFGLQLNNGSTGNGPFIGSDGADIFTISTAGGAERMRVNANGEVLIGTTTDNGAYLLQVNSQIYATNATIATSDARFKTNVESLTDATSVIEALRPVAFDFIPHAERNFATERQVGLIAQEAQSALAGTDYADSVVAQCGDHLGLAYEKLMPVLIKALQESNARIAALEERLNHA
jgi:hypothetical protein